MSNAKNKLKQYTDELVAKGVEAALAAELAAKQLASEEALELAAEENGKLQEKLEAAKVENKLQAKVITFKGEKYAVTIPKFKLGDESYTAEDLDNDSKLVEKLLKMGFGGLVKLGGK